MAKLFLGGVSPGTDKELLESHFSQYGTVIDAVVMYKDGRHRGFGFVTFDDFEAMNAALAEPQVIDGRTIDVKAALAKGEAPPPQTPAYGGKSNGYDPYGGGKAMGGYGGGGQKGGSFPSAAPGKGASPKGGPPCDKVFVGGLPQSTTEETVQAYFSQFGTLIDCVVMKDRETGRSRGFGFVQFDNTDSVEQVMAEYDNHQIDEKWVECKKAVPQMKGGGGGFGGGFGGGKGFGKAPRGAGPWARPPQQAGFGGKYGAPGGYHAGKGCKGGKGYGPPAVRVAPAVAAGPYGAHGAYAGPRPGAPVGFRPF